uniref:Glycine N-acyltransferase-like protein n=1 Tax=Pseudonaja textilis TaxID=8673 RepID=A0A670XUR9_PSETE
RLVHTQLIQNPFLLVSCLFPFNRYLTFFLKVYGAVLNINRGNPFKKEVIVDSWPEFKAVITRRQKEVKQYFDALDYFTNACAVFYKNLQAYQALLENPEAINWELKNSGGAMLSISTVTNNLFRLVPAPKLTSLDASHASLLNNTWSRGGSDQCLKYLINLICCFPSMCILDEHGCPISWGLTDQFATMIHGYTLPKHRRKGYNRLIATNLAKMLHSKGFPAQGNVLEDNLPPLTLLKSMNQHHIPVCNKSTNGKPPHHSPPFHMF